jgi:hypothetical protein
LELEACIASHINGKERKQQKQTYTIIPQLLNQNELQLTF